MSAANTMSGESIDIGRVLDEGEWSGYQKFVVGLSAFTIILDGVDNQLLGIAIPSIMKEWSASRQAFANVPALGFLGMLMGGAAAGLAGDRFGRRVALIGSMLLFGAMTLVASRVNSVGALGVLRMLVGVGLGGAIPNAATLSSEFVPRRVRPFAVTLTIVCVPLGGMLAGLAAQRALPAVGWRGLFAIGGLIPFGVAFLLMWLLPESPRFLARHPNRWPELFRILRRAGHVLPAVAGAVDAAVVDRTEGPIAKTSGSRLFSPEFRHDTFALWGAYFSCMLAVYLGFTWVPSMLNSVGLGALANVGITAFNLGGVFGAVAGSLVIARIGSRVPMLAMAAGAAACALFTAWPMNVGAASDATGVVIMLTLIGGFINAAQTTLYALGTYLYPTTVRSTGVGTAAAVGRAGAILSTYLGAWALDSGGSRLFFAVIAAAMFVSFVSLSLIRRHVPAPARVP